MIMALPIGLIWGLKLAQIKKAGIIALFCVGWIAIAAAVIRVVSIGVRAGSSTPSSTWLAFWGTIESGIAVIIGTAPGLYSTARKVHTSRKESKYAGYNGGYQRHTGDVAAKSPAPAFKSVSSHPYSTASIDDDDQGIGQPSAVYSKSADKTMSFSRPSYLRPITKVSHREVDDDLEMTPRDQWSTPRIFVTKTVRSERGRRREACGELVSNLE